MKLTQFIQNCHTVVQQIFDVTTLRKMYFKKKKNKQTKKNENLVKTDKKRGKQYLRSQTLFLCFKEITNSDSVVESVLELTLESTVPAYAYAVPGQGYTNLDTSMPMQSPVVCSYTACIVRDDERDTSTAFFAATCYYVD
jgi:hypothetical protein